MKRNLVCLLILLAACSGTESPQALVFQTNLSIIDGDGQTDTVAKQLARPVVAQAADQLSAQPLPGIVLNWYRVVGSDTTFMGAGVTNDSGIGRYRPVLGTKAGPQEIVAWALDNNGSRAEFANASATALAGRVATAWMRPARDTVFGGDTLFLEYGYRDAYANTSLDGCASPDSVGWTWTPDAIADPIAEYELVGFIFQPGTTFYILTPHFSGERRFVRFVMNNVTTGIQFRAYNVCRGTEHAATVTLRAK